MSEPRIQRGLCTVFGLTINLNTIITTVLGSVCCTAVGALAFWVHALTVTIQTMERDVPKLERTLHRLEVEYPPLPKANFNASVKPTPNPQ